MITDLFFTGKTNKEILYVLEGVHGVRRRLALQQLLSSCIIYYNIPIFCQFELVNGKAETSMLEGRRVRDP